jgi:alpha-1,2-mannosyltransferase
MLSTGPNDGFLFQAARSPIFAGVTGALLAIFATISIGRIVALQTYFRAPMTLLLHFQYSELPALAIYNYPSHYPKLDLTNFEHANEQIDVSILEQKNLTLCYGPEWYRFPSSFLIPDVVRTEFIKTDLGIQLPKHFVENRAEEKEVRKSLKKRLEIAQSAPTSFNDQNIEMMDRYVSLFFSSIKYWLG